MAEKQRTEIDAGLLEELRDRAHEQHRTESELLEEIVRSYLVVAPRRSGSLEEFFGRLEQRRGGKGVEPLSKDEATTLARDELHAMRRERRELERMDQAVPRTTSVLQTRGAADAAETRKHRLSSSPDQLHAVL